MEVIIFIIIVITAVLAIASGVWVAFALISAISKHQDVPATRCQANDKDCNDKIL